MTEPSHIVYEPESTTVSSWRIWGTMVRNLGSSHELIWRLFMRNWSARYRQSWLGYTWAVIPTLGAALAFSFLSNKRVVVFGETPIPYVPYALWGLAVWQLFVGIVMECSKSLLDAANMITRINFNKDALVFAAAGQALFDFLIRAMLVVAAFAIYRVTPAWTCWLAPIALLPVVLLGLGLGMLLAVTRIAGDDLANGLIMLIGMGMFATPVIYPPMQTWPYMILNYINPVTPALITSHDLLEVGTLSMPGAYACSSLISLLVFCISWRLFVLATPRIAERL